MKATVLQKRAENICTGTTFYKAWNLKVLELEKPLSKLTSYTINFTPVIAVIIDKFINQKFTNDINAPILSETGKPYAIKSAFTTLSHKFAGVDDNKNNIKIWSRYYMFIRSDIWIFDFILK